MSTRPLGDWLADILIFLGYYFFGIGLVIGTVLWADIRGKLREGEWRPMGLGLLKF